MNKQPVLLLFGLLLFTAAWLQAESVFEKESYRDYAGQVICAQRWPENLKTPHFVLNNLLATAPGKTLDLEVLEMDYKRLLNTQYFYDVTLKLIPQVAPITTQSQDANSPKNPSLGRDKPCSIELIWEFSEKFTYGLNMTWTYGGKALQWELGPFDDNFLGSLGSLGLILRNYRNLWSGLLSYSSRNFLGHDLGFAALLDLSQRVVFAYDAQNRPFATTTFLNLEMQSVGLNYSQKSDWILGLNFIHQNYRLDTQANPRWRWAKISSTAQFGLLKRHNFLFEGLSTNISAGLEFLLEKEEYKIWEESAPPFAYQIGFSSIMGKKFWGLDQWASRYVWQFNSQKFPVKLLNLGGLGQIRGFLDRQQSGQAYFYGNQEWRHFMWQGLFPLIGPVIQQIIFFLDGGLIYQSHIDRYPFLLSAGIGWRVNPVHFLGFLWALDLAWPLHPSISSQAGPVLHFGIGQFF